MDEALACNDTKTRWHNDLRGEDRALVPAPDERW